MQEHIRGPGPPRRSNPRRTSAVPGSDRLSSRRRPARPLGGTLCLPRAYEAEPEGTRSPARAEPAKLSAQSSRLSARQSSKPGGAELAASRRRRQASLSTRPRSRQAREAEDLAREVAERPRPPARKRGDEAQLVPTGGHGRRQDVDQRAAQGTLADPVHDQVAAVEGEGELDQAVVEHRDAGLDRVGHRVAVLVAQELGKLARGDEIGELASRASSRPSRRRGRAGSARAAGARPADRRLRSPGPAGARRSAEAGRSARPPSALLAHRCPAGAGRRAPRRRSARVAPAGAGRPGTGRSSSR